MNDQSPMNAQDNVDLEDDSTLRDSPSRIFNVLRLLGFIVGVTSASLIIRDSTTQESFEDKIDGCLSQTIDDGSNCLDSIFVDCQPDVIVGSNDFCLNAEQYLDSRIPEIYISRVGKMSAQNINSN